MTDFENEERRKYMEYNAVKLKVYFTSNFSSGDYPTDGFV